MSFRIGTGRLRARTFPTTDECEAALAEALRRNRERGNGVRREDVQSQPHPRWIIETPSGTFVAMYQLTEPGSSSSG